MPYCAEVALQRCPTKADVIAANTTVERRGKAVMSFTADNGDVYVIETKEPVGAGFADTSLRFTGRVKSRKRGRHTSCAWWYVCGRFTPGDTGTMAYSDKPFSGTAL